MEATTATQGIKDMDEATWRRFRSEAVLRGLTSAQMIRWLLDNVQPATTVERPPVALDGATLTGTRE